MSFVSFTTLPSSFPNTLSAPEFTAYTEPIALELAKQWDLRTLSKFLPPPITQADIDIWYPEPLEVEPDLEDEDPIDLFDPDASDSDESI